MGADSYRVLITGSRTWDADALIRERLDALLADTGRRLVIVHGACPAGADAIADTWAGVRGVATERCPADWKRYGRRAGHLRNAQMVDTLPDLCLAFNRDHSPGTSGCAAAARARGIPTEEMDYESEVSRVRSDMCGAVEPHLGAMCALARHSGNRHQGPKGEWQTWTS